MKSRHLSLFLLFGIGKAPKLLGISQRIAMKRAEITINLWDLFSTVLVQDIIFGSYFIWFYTANKAVRNHTNLKDCWYSSWNFTKLAMAQTSFSILDIMKNLKYRIFIWNSNNNKRMMLRICEAKNAWKMLDLECSTWVGRKALDTLKHL